MGSFVDSLINGAAGAITSIPNAIFGHYENNRNMHFQSDEAKAQRDWQSSENAKNRQWQEQMYNLYNSPSAMMKQYKEAGLNPFLMASQNGVGQGMSATPSSGSGAAASGSVPPAMPFAEGSYLQSLGVRSQIANQSSQSFRNILSTIVDSIPKLGKDGAARLFDAYMPLLSGLNLEDTMYFKEMRSKIYNMDMDSLLADFQYETGKKYTPEQKRLEFAQLGANTKNLLKSVEVLDSQKELNEGSLRRIASEIAENFANAFNLRKMGEYYEVSASQLSTINQMLDLQLQDALADFAFNTGVRKWKKEIPNRSVALGLFLGNINATNTNLGVEGNKFLKYGKAITSMVGDLLKVNFGLSTNRTNFNNLNPKNGSQMFYSGDGYYMNNGVLMKGSW